MGPKSTAGKSNKGKADDTKSTKSKVSAKIRTRSVAKFQASKINIAGTPVEEVPKIVAAEKV
jgi:hypothetical protein